MKSDAAGRGGPVFVLTFDTAGARAGGAWPPPGLEDSLPPRGPGALTWPVMERELEGGGRTVAVARSEAGDRVQAEHKEFWRPDGRVIACAVVGFAGAGRVYSLFDVTAEKQELRRLRLIRHLGERIGKAADFAAALKAVLRTVCRHADWQYAEAWVPDPGDATISCGPVWHVGSPALDRFEAETHTLRLSRGESIVGRSWASGTFEHIADITAITPRHFARWSQGIAAGLRAIHAVPLLADGQVISVLLFASSAARPRDPLIIDLIAAIAPHLSMVLARKRLEAEHAGVQARMADLLATAGDAIVSVDSSHRIVLFNRQAERLFGYASDEIVGEPLERLLPHAARKSHREHMARMQRGPERRIMSGRPEIRGLRKDGSEFPAEASVSRLTIGTETFYSAVVRDLTAEREAAAELQAAKEQAEAANRAKSDFLANMSHELRTPLNAIIGFSQLIRDRTFGDDLDRYAEYAEDINRSGLHLLSLINDILDLSRIEGSRAEIAREPVSVSEVLDEVGSMLRHTAAAKSVGLNCSATGPDRVVTDRRALKQILINLLSNAVKFAEGGTVTVILESDADGALTIVVADTGIGMNEDTLGKLFRPFFQIDASHTRRYGGTGLGLAIVKRHVDLLGGDISVESELGRGARFTIRLPPLHAAAPRKNGTLGSAAE